MACWSSTARACSVLAAALGLSATACFNKPLPVFGQVSGFNLTSQTGAAFDGESLTGNVWVAEFFFTHCNGPCPRMNSRFRQIAKTFAGRNDFKLVSFTVDPARDTPPVLAEYARTFSADPARWVFLTGPMERLNQLGRYVFLLSDVDGKLDHSTRFVLVDRRRQIRGYYQSGDSDSIHQLTEDIGRLLKEKS